MNRPVNQIRVGIAEPNSVVGIRPDVIAVGSSPTTRAMPKTRPAATSTYPCLS
jgi:hypothetical protein